MMNILYQVLNMKKKIILIILSIILILTAVTLRFARYYRQASEDYAEIGIKGDLGQKIITAINESLENRTPVYSEISKITYLDDGRVGSIDINAAAVNSIALELANTVYTAVYESEHDYGIPLGNALGSYLLSGKGPKIGVRVIPLSAVAYTIDSKLISAGINQTLHRISVRYSVTAKCIAPFDENIISIDGETVIAETVIIGEVPGILFSRSSGIGQFFGDLE